MKSKTKFLIPAIAVIALSIFAYAKFFGRHESLKASGTLEARNINVGSKIGGRITQVLAHEGDRVQAHQLLVAFDDAELEAKLLQSRGQLLQAQANLRKMLHGSRPEEIAESQAAVLTPRGGPGFRAEELSQAKADLERAQADFVDADLNFKRADQLAKDGVVSAQYRDDAEAKVKIAKAQVLAAEHNVSAAQARLDAAIAVRDRTVHGFRKEDIDAARAQLTLAQGQLKEAQARYIEREVRAPANAVVEVMDLRPGDLLPPNSIVAKLLEADQLYVMVYVPEPQIGQVHVGQKAVVQVDSFPKETFPAVVEQIRQKAEFLPRNVQTSDEREHQVIGVKLRVDNSSNKLRAGINADVKFIQESK